MHRRAAKLLSRDHFIGHRLHNVGAGNEHVAGAAHHEYEVSHSRRIDVTAGARAHNDADLRDHARGYDIALEDLTVTAKSRDTFLDTCTAGIKQADDRASRLHRHVLHLDDLLRVRLRKRATEHGKVLGKEVNGPAVDRTPAGDNAIAGNLRFFHAEFGDRKSTRLNSSHPSISYAVF